MKEIQYTRRAQRALTRMPQAIAERIIASIENIAADNTEGLDIKPLTGREGYRLRVGRYRAIYDYRDNELIVRVLNVGPRGDVYK